MKPLFLAAASGLVGAALAGALFIAFPSLTTGKDDDDAAGVKAAAPAAPEGVVMLDKAQATRAGIAMVPLAPAQVATVRQGLARALDISTLSAIQSEIVSAEAASATSDADYKRQRALAGDDQSASAHAVELARAQAVADRARLDAAKQRIGLEFGPGLTRLSLKSLGDLLHAATAGQASLIRVDFADGAAPPGALVRIGETTVRLLGPAATADTHLQSAGSLAIIHGPLARELGSGRVLPATMAANTSENGVLVPREAIIRYQGGLWVYRVEPGGGYRRIELTDARAEAQGWFARSGVKPGDRIASGGLGVLLSIDRGGEPVGEDD
ncbi:efflux RND transporter periplasmic adaptor subunit [Sphingobium sp. EM0848]|uniref:efflux RND transporter periplasmic adaptor subunit n=1 Tax=Sphingobium sp. EM0848 TaxID=2743473 RepID=UPI00159BF2AF|nr:efflux RND transporter periplasmic adaptor subunit [Sphingobium sp. EM0848]